MDRTANQDTGGVRRALGHAAMAVVVVAAALTVGVGAAYASTPGNNVEFTLTVESSSADDEERLNSRARQNVAKEVVSRIERRLEAIDIRHFAVEATGSDVQVRVYGNHDIDAIKSALIPAGMLEIRPVLVDSNPWLSVAPQLPEGVQFYHEPGSIRPDSFFLFAPSPQLLYQSMDLVSSEDHHIEVFPHGEGWRTLHLGEVAATHNDVADVKIDRNRSGASFVSLTLTGEGAQQIRSQARAAGANQLAVIVDGEVVALKHFNERRFSESVTLDAPEHLESRQMRSLWATQVGGRLAAPIPVRIAEVEE